MGPMGPGPMGPYSARRMCCRARVNRVNRVNRWWANMFLPFLFLQGSVFVSFCFALEPPIVVNKNDFGILGVGNSLNR